MMIILFIMEFNMILVGGIPTPLKNMKVSWDDDIPNIWKHKIHVPNHQPGKYMELYGNIWKQTIHMVTNIWK